MGDSSLGPPLLSILPLVRDFVRSKSISSSSYYCTCFTGVGASSMCGSVIITLLDLLDYLDLRLLTLPWREYFSFFFSLIVDLVLGPTTFKGTDCNTTSSFLGIAVLIFMTSCTTGKEASFFTSRSTVFLEMGTTLILSPSLDGKTNFLGFNSISLLELSLYAFYVFRDSIAAFMKWY